MNVKVILLSCDVFSPKTFSGRTKLFYPQNSLVSNKKNALPYTIISDFLENFIRNVKPAEIYIHNNHKHTVIYDAIYKKNSRI